MRKTLFAIVMAVVVSGCGGRINIEKVSGSGAQTGVPWNLPMTQFQITITRQLVACGATPAALVSATASAQVVADNNERYVLDNPGWFSSGKIESELTAAGYSNGLSSEVNDDTAAFFAAVVKAGTAIAIMALDGGNGSAGKTGQSGSGLACDPAVETQLQLRRQRQADLEQATDDLNARTAEVLRLTALTGKPDQKTLLEKALGAQAQADQKVDLIKADLLKAQHATTDTVEVTWPMQGNELALPQAKAWAAPAGLRKKWFVDDTSPGAEAGWKRFADDLKVTAAILIKTDDGSCAQEEQKDTGSTGQSKPDGLPVRFARDGWLVVSQSSVPPACSMTESNPASPPDGVALVQRQRMLQTGPIYYIKMRGRAFHSESATVKMDDAGNPTSIHVGQTGAAATAAASSIGDAVAAIGGIDAAKKARELAGTKARTDQYNADVALANAEASAALAKPQAARTAQKALADATVAQMKSADALDAATKAATGKD